MRVYIEDILIFANTPEELRSRVIEVLTVLNEVGFKLNVKDFFCGSWNSWAMLLEGKGFVPTLAR